MKYYSTVLKQLFDTEEALVEAEKKQDAIEKAKAKAETLKKEARAKRAKEVEDALKEAEEARAKANKLLRDFTKDYGYFHMSYSTEDTDNLESNWDDLFKIWF